TAATGRQALDAVRSNDFDLVLLDVMLPDLDGFEVCRRMRQDGERVPVLFLTARDATEDRVRGLTLGGDDYVAKPFSLEEVVARIHAILRRHGRPTRTSQVIFADLEMDDDAHIVRRAGEPIDLSPTEYKLLRFLLGNAGRVLSRAQILDHVWEYDFGGNTSVVDTYISYLRKKVDRFDPPLIHTIRGVGYSLRTA
ncbi:MAG TPA: response regulator transcription factor, partial [Acidimicrobiia bacterium]|nr:response regulator transcription factor [Acidimicrobiia bacterium]